jgi:hypothetical protein
MVGMLQILTYMLGVYLVVKGIQVLQIALASGREKRDLILWIGALTLLGTIIAAVGLIQAQEKQAALIAARVPDIGEGTP